MDRRSPKNWHRIILLPLLVGITLSCIFVSEAPAPTETLPSPTFTQLPTSTPAILQEGEIFSVDKLALTLLEHKLESCYISEYGDEQCPPQGAALLWVHLRRENVGNPSDLPIYSCYWFTVLYQGAELNPSFYYDNHSERKSWNEGGCGELYVGFSDEGWVSFEVPAGIIMSGLLLRIKSYIGPQFEQLWKLEE